MNNLLLTLSAITILYNLSIAQPIIQWQKTFGSSGLDIANSIQQTNDGGYIVVGSSNVDDGDVSGNHGASDYWVVKLDLSGNLQWQKSLGGTGCDIANSVEQTTDGGYIVAGYVNSPTTNNGDITDHNGGADCWIVKLDTSGNIQWQKSLGGSMNEIAFSIHQTNDGGYIFSGQTYSNDSNVSGNHYISNISSDIWIGKLDSIGILLWQKCLGGTNDEYSYSIIQTNDGGYIVAGETLSNDGDITNSYGNHDYWVVKLNTSGNIQWQKTFGGSNTDIASSILQTNDGGYIVAGYSNSIDGDVTGNHSIGENFTYDYWIVKLDSTGNIQWEKSLGGSEYDIAGNIQQTNDGGYIVEGYSYSNDGDITLHNGSIGYVGGFADYWIVKLYNNGNIQWQKTIGGTDDDGSFNNQYNGGDIKQTTDGGFILTGFTNSNDGDITSNHGSNDYWVVKLDSCTITNIESKSISQEVTVYPNPANDNVNINYITSKDGKVTISLYNILGEKVTDIVNNNLISGTYKSTIDVHTLSSGVYSIKMTVDGNVIVKRLIISR